MSFSTPGSCCEAADRKKINPCQHIAIPNTRRDIDDGRAGVKTCRWGRRPLVCCEEETERWGEYAGLRTLTCHFSVSGVFWCDYVKTSGSCGFIFRTTAQSTQVTTVYFCAAESPALSLFLKLLTGIWNLLVVCELHFWHETDIKNLRFLVSYFVFYFVVLSCCVLLCASSLCSFPCTVIGCPALISWTCPSLC